MDGLCYEASMKTFITGSRGRVGSALMRSIPQAIGLDKPDVDLSAPVATNPFGDIGETDAVIHCAANGNPEQSFGSAQANLRIDLNVLDLCVRAGVRRFVYASSLWAEPDEVFHPTFYGFAKRSFIEVARRAPIEFRPVVVRWFCSDEVVAQAPAWVQPYRMSEADLVAAFGSALTA